MFIDHMQTTGLRSRRILVTFSNVQQYLHSFSPLKTQQPRPNRRWQRCDANLCCRPGSKLSWALKRTVPKCHMYSLTKENQRLRDVKFVGNRFSSSNLTGSTHTASPGAATRPHWDPSPSLVDSANKRGRHCRNLKVSQSLHESRLGWLGTISNVILRSHRSHLTLWHLADPETWATVLVIHLFVLVKFWKIFQNIFKGFIKQKEEKRRKNELQNWESW